MTKQRSEDDRHRQRVHRVRVAASLLDGPRTAKQVSDTVHGYLRALGLFRRTDRQARDRAYAVRDDLEVLTARGWVLREDERYALTAQGRREVLERLAQLRARASSLRGLLRPRTVSIITLAVHWLLAALKLPAGLLSGSVGLINDATDTLLDGFSSLLVFAGIRFDRERAVNVLLVLLMLATGLITFAQAVRRFFLPIAPDVEPLTFLAAIVSAVICSLLYVYQRAVGLRSGSLALITQSVDSRNHVIVAVSVTAGLAASALRFQLLDTLVGLVVALLILKSAIELAIDTARSFGEEDLDLSRFRLPIAGRFDAFREAQLRDWMLYLVAREGVTAREELTARALQALDFNRIPALRALGLAPRRPDDVALVDHALAELFRRGWLSGEARLSVTASGKKRLGRRLQ